MRLLYLSQVKFISNSKRYFEISKTKVGLTLFSSALTYWNWLEMAVEFDITVKFSSQSQPNPSLRAKENLKI